MAEIGNEAGGTPGAQKPFPQFAYTDLQWESVAAAIGDAATTYHRNLLEMIAVGYLSEPHTAQTISAIKIEVDRCRRIAKAARGLLSVLEEDKSFDHASVYKPGTNEFYSRLSDLANCDNYADDLRSEVPHGNSNYPWNRYLERLCLFWVWTLERKASKARKPTGQAYGPLIEFLVAAAAPVKTIVPPANLSGAMTGEVAYDAVQKFQDKHTQKYEESRRKVIEAVMKSRDGEDISDLT